MRVFLVRTALAAVLASGVPATLLAQQTPFGQPLDGWTFTQEPHGDKIKCRAALKSGDQVYHIGAVTHNGGSYVSAGSGSVKVGQYPGSTLIAGSDTYHVTANSDGERIWVRLDKADLEKIAKAGRYTLNVALPGGSVARSEVVMNASAPKALEGVFACIEANGG